VPKPEGEVAVILLALVTTILVPAFVPKATAVTPERFVPVIVTEVPPAEAPDVGEMPVTVGAAAYVNWSAVTAALVPPGVVTSTSTVPEPDGAFAVIEVLLTTLTFVAGFVPKLTAVAPVKLEPVIVTSVPPAVPPAVGEMPVTAGAATYVNLSAAPAELVPPGVVTSTSTVPDPVGDFAVIDVLFVTDRFVADPDPKATLVAPVKFVPVIVTVVPLPRGPDVGEIPVTVGSAT
jgi:hypothetical protein